MAKNFIGELVIFLSKSTVISMIPADIGEIMVNYWKVYPHPTRQGIATVFIDKREQVFYQQDKEKPQYASDEEDACYAVIQRVSDKNNNADDFIIDVSGNPEISEFDFFPLSENESRHYLSSPDYLVFADVPFKTTHKYNTGEDDDVVYSEHTQEVPDKHSLADFDLQLIDQYSQEELLVFQDLATKKEKYMIAAAIRDHLEFRKSN